MNVKFRRQDLGATARISCVLCALLVGVGAPSLAQTEERGRGEPDSDNG